MKWLSRHNMAFHLAAVAADCCGAEVELPVAALCCWHLAPKALHLGRLCQKQQIHSHAFHCQM